MYTGWGGGKRPCRVFLVLQTHITFWIGHAALIDWMLGPLGQHPRKENSQAFHAGDITWDYTLPATKVETNSGCCHALRNESGVGCSRKPKNPATPHPEPRSEPY